MYRRFIKVYVDDLLALAKEKKLRRAEIGELLLLALSIDKNNVAVVSKKEIVRAVGMASPRSAHQLHKHLKAKGVLDWDYDPDLLKPRFRLPEAFGPSGNDLGQNDGLAPDERQALEAWRRGDKLEAMRIIMNG